VNRSPHTSIDFQVPEEVWSGNLVYYSMLRIFECPVFAHVNDRKLALRAVKWMFLGYASESKGCRMWCPNSKKVIQRRDITFNENAILSSAKEFVVSSAGTCDQEDASRKVKIEVETVATQGGAADQPSREVQATESSSSTTSPNQP